jgi:hypothetical protein
MGFFAGWSEGNREWTVVDTPGLGDFPERQPGQNDEQYAHFRKKRRSTQLSAITGALRENGGMVFYIWQTGRLGDKRKNHTYLLVSVAGPEPCLTALSGAIPGSEGG